MKEQQQAAAPDPWTEQQAREAELAREMNELNVRIRYIKSTVLDPLTLAKQELAGIKARRLQSGSAALIDGKPQDLQAIDADIAKCEARIAVLSKDSDIATTAMATLTDRVREKQAEAEMLRQDGLRTRVRQLESALSEFAPEFAAKAEEFKAAVVEMSALALARDKIGPMVQGNTPIGSNGLAQVDISAPHLPAYEKIGGHFNLYAAAEARMRVILAEIGLRL